MQIESNHAAVVFQLLLKSGNSDLQFNRLLTLIRLRFTSNQAFFLFLSLIYVKLSPKWVRKSLEVPYIFFLSFHLVRKITHQTPPKKLQINMLNILSAVFLILLLHSLLIFSGHEGSTNYFVESVENIQVVNECGSPALLTSSVVIIVDLFSYFCVWFCCINISISCH